MSSKMAVIVALALVLGARGIQAHKGHSHKIMGTVTTRHENHLEVKTPDGKTVTITLNEKTSILRGKAKINVNELQAGQRVVIDVGDGKDPLSAREVKLGTAGTTAKK
jgi:hypothetical protein